MPARKRICADLKKGKLPTKIVSEDYELEYGTDTLEIHKDAIEEGQRVIVIDDLIATGCIAVAAIKLAQKPGGVVIEFAVVVSLPDIGDSQKIQEHGTRVHAQTEFEGD